jgi:hypothetical protein
MFYPNGKVANCYNLVKNHRVMAKWRLIFGLQYSSVTVQPTKHTCLSAAPVRRPAYVAEGYFGGVGKRFCAQAHFGIQAYGRREKKTASKIVSWGFLRLRSLVIFVCVFLCLSRLFCRDVS